MRMIPHKIQPATYTQSEYGEPTVTYGTAGKIGMHIGWVESYDADKNNALYRQYKFVGVTRENPSVGSLIDDKYVIGYVEHGRLNRCFMNYADGKDYAFSEVSSAE